jgi:hypothetical protein
MPIIQVSQDGDFRNMSKSVKVLFTIWAALFMVTGGACNRSDDPVAGDQPGAGAESIVAKAVQEAAPAQVVGNRTVVYYFHGNMRCVSCRRIESYAKEAIKAGFSSELADGHLEIMAVNVEEPGNRHFVEEFQLYAPSVVVTRMEGDQRTQWKNLDQVWRLVRDRQAFQQYVQRETRAMIKGA